jgi:hypothetical protein
MLLQYQLYDGTGTSTQISGNGNVVGIGTPLSDVSGQQNSGVASLHEWIGGIWEQKGSVLEGDNTDDEFGADLALSKDGNILAVGASNAGYVKVYKYGGNDWQALEGGVDLQGSSTGDLFGSSIALSFEGSTMAAGSSKGGMQWQGMRRDI